MNSQQVSKYHPEVYKILNNIEKVIIGKHDEIVLCLVALLGKGHVLLEDVPGVGKTMMVKTLATSIQADFKRIQFTPDLLPSDVMGVSIYNPKDLEFQFRPGPLMANIVLADEINRTSPKTQSALLEGMEEGHVTVDGDTLTLPNPFFVMATQNPVEYEGTYPLPEAQLDRFMLKLKMGYPTPSEEMEILNGTGSRGNIPPALTVEEVIGLQEEVSKVYVDESVKKYIIDIVNRTRNHVSVQLGVSPRGSIALLNAAKSFACIQGRDYCIPDDVKFLAPYVLAHRLLLNSEARFSGMHQESVIEEILNRVAVPVTKEKGSR